MQRCSYSVDRVALLVCKLVWNPLNTNTLSEISSSYAVRIKSGSDLSFYISYCIKNYATADSLYCYCSKNINLFYLIWIIFLLNIFMLKFLNCRRQIKFPRNRSEYGEFQHMRGDIFSMFGWYSDYSFLGESSWIWTSFHLGFLLRRLLGTWYDWICAFFIYTDYKI